jgi:hypothetical protein
MSEPQERSQRTTLAHLAAAAKKRLAKRLVSLGFVKGKRDGVHVMRLSEDVLLYCFCRPFRREGRGFPFARKWAGLRAAMTLLKQAVEGREPPGVITHPTRKTRALLEHFPSEDVSLH